MKQIALSVPSTTFPAVLGDQVRIRVRNLTGLDTVDATVVAFEPGCSSFVRVVLRYDETLLPPHVSALSFCNIAGFLRLCPCCSSRPTWEVVAPGTAVAVGATYYVGRTAGPLRLDAVKFFSPTPAPVPLRLNVLRGGVALFAEPLLVPTSPQMVPRMMFSAAFASGQVPPDTLVELQVTDGPSTVYYDEPWYGLLLAFIGENLP